MRETSVLVCKIDLVFLLQNRQLSLQTVPTGVNSNRQNHIGHQHIVSSSQQSSSISLNQSSGVHASSLTKSLAALGLDSVTPRKVRLYTLYEFSTQTFYYHIFGFL